MSKPNVPAVLNTVGDLRVGTADSLGEAHAAPVSAGA